MSENRLSSRNAAIQEMLTDGEKIKNFYRCGTVCDRSYGRYKRTSGGVFYGRNLHADRKSVV